MSRSCQIGIRSGANKLRKRKDAVCFVTLVLLAMRCRVSILSIPGIHPNSLRGTSWKMDGGTTSIINATSSRRSRPSWESKRYAFKIALHSDNWPNESNQLSHWYNVPRQEVERRGGRTLFKQHSSLEDALRAAYPEFSWQSMRFLGAAKRPSGHWRDHSNVMKALDAAEERIGIRQVRPSSSG